jgi:hypothetical protein
LPRSPHLSGEAVAEGIDEHLLAARHDHDAEEAADVGVVAELDQAVVVLGR